MVRPRIEKIVWYDAADSDNIELNDVLVDSTTQDFLVKRETYGIVLKEDRYGIIILKDKDETGTCEITAVPRGWYTRKKKVVKKKKRGKTKK